MASPVDDGELQRVGAPESNGISRNRRYKRVVREHLHGDRITNHYSTFMD